MFFIFSWWSSIEVQLMVESFVNKGAGVYKEYQEELYDQGE